MTARKTPILLRPAPVSDTIVALHRYTKKVVQGREVLDSGIDGKQDVTADFDAVLLELLIPDSTSDVIAILDGAAKGMDLEESERKEIKDLRERLVRIIKRHNARRAGE